MGYGGKVVEQRRARELRAEGWTYTEIAAELSVSKSSVSLWCRDVEVNEVAWADRVRRNRNQGARPPRPHRLQLAKLAEIERCHQLGHARFEAIDERELFVAGVALYAGEGNKTGAAVGFANSDPRMIALFLLWLRTFFEVDESRLRLRLYLHEGLDLDAANSFWSALTKIPLSQFGAPYRAVADQSIRRSKHTMGCPGIRYNCVHTLRRILGFVDGLLSLPGQSGVAQLAEQVPVKDTAVGSSPTPGAHGQISASSTT